MHWVGGGGQRIIRSHCIERICLILRCLQCRRCAAASLVGLPAGSFAQHTWHGLTQQTLPSLAGHDSAFCIPDVLHCIYLFHKSHWIARSALAFWSWPWQPDASFFVCTFPPCFFFFGSRCSGGLDMMSGELTYPECSAGWAGFWASEAQNWSLFLQWWLSKLFLSAESYCIHFEECDRQQCNIQRV